MRNSTVVFLLLCSLANALHRVKLHKRNIVGEKIGENKAEVGWDHFTVEVVTENEICIDGKCSIGGDLSWICQTIPQYCIFLCLFDSTYCTTSTPAITTTPISKTTIKQSETSTSGYSESSTTSSAATGSPTSPSQHSISLDDVGNNYYYGTITIGTPPQEFIIDFDTGSSDVAIDCEKCTDCASQKKFNTSASSTYATDNVAARIDYGSQTYEGYFASDIVCIGTDGQFCTNQSQGITCVVRESDKGSVASGIFGLAFQEISENPNPIPLEQLLYGQNCEEPVFAFYLNNVNETAGELTFCGTDPNHYKEEITYFPLTAQDWWSFNLDEFTIGDTSIVKNSPAVMDSGSTLIAVPTKVLHQIEQELGYVPLTYYPCGESNKNITFTISGKNYTFSSSDYMFRLNYVDMCVLAFGASANDQWIFGDVFMRKYYTVFDYGNKQIGLADIVH